MRSSKVRQGGLKFLSKRIKKPEGDAADEEGMFSSDEDESDLEDEGQDRGQDRDHDQDQN